MSKKTAKAILEAATLRNMILDNFKKNLDEGNKEEVIKTFTSLLDSGCEEAYYHGYYQTAYKTLKLGILIGTGVFIGIKAYKAHKLLTSDATIKVEIQNNEEDSDE